MTPTATMQAPAAPAWRGDDFPHWLPPMLVRELRQGIQSGSFFWTFLILQFALLLFVLFALLVQAGASETGAVRSFDGLFWGILATGLGLVMPLRGLTAVAFERTGNNLDLVRLTKLSATRIVAGKWLALVAQVLLVASAVLPYLTVRYFFGGVNVVADLVTLGWLLVWSAVLGAVAVYYSTRPQRERVGLLILLVFLGIVGLNAVATMTVRGGFTAPLGNGWLTLTIAALYAALFLEAAAASIAPPAENHALPKRLLALCCAAIIAGVGLWGSAAWFWSLLGVLGLPVLFITIGGLCERPVRVRRMHTPFARGGLAGRLAAAAFTPGWATGLVFFVLAFGLVATGLFARAAADNTVEETMPFVSLAAAAILLPVPLLLLLPRLGGRGFFYAGLQGLCIIPWGVDLTVRELPGFRSDGLLPLVALFPLAGLLRLLNNPPDETRVVLFFAGCLITAIILAVVIRPWLREMRETQRLVDGGPRA
ncbi:MAG: hypothetical protein ACK6CT_05855 [Planctomycetia bacterium]|jgi:hypothetical protein